MLTHTYLLHNMQFQTDFDPIIFHPTGKVRHPKYYKHLKKGSHQSKYSHLSNKRGAHTYRF